MKRGFLNLATKPPSTPLKPDLGPKTSIPMDDAKQDPPAVGESMEKLTIKKKKKNEDDLEKLLKDGSKVRKITMDQFSYEINNGWTQKIDKRWDAWRSSNYQLWKKKNEEEQRRELDMRWTYLKDMLHREGTDTTNHRLLLSVKFIEPDRRVKKPKETILEFKVGSPDRGLVSISRLVMDRGLGLLPRQTVGGLLCFTSEKNDAFLVYNPVTQESSPWIKNKNPGKIVFGFNPQTDEHKVICISSNKSGSGQVVEIFTVGKNTWRRIDAVPPISIGHEPSFYVGGCLYWRFREPEDGGLELILRFDIVTEKFRVIPIPNHIIDSRRYKWSQTVELTEVDGRIAVLDWMGELNISLSPLHEDVDGSIEWNKEIIDMPPEWNGKPDLSIEVLTGTNLIFIQYESRDFFYYYNRNTKESLRFPISPDSRGWCWERIVQV